MKKYHAIAESDMSKAWLEARTPGTIGAVQGAFEDLLTHKSPRAPEPEDVKALASLIVMESSWGGNLETQLMKRGRKALELLRFVQEHERTLDGVSLSDTRKLLWRWVIRAWEAAPFVSEERGFAEALLALPSENSHQLQETLRDALGAPNAKSDLGIVKRLLVLVDEQSNPTVVSFMLRRAAMITLRFPEENKRKLIAMAQKVAEVL